MRPFDQGSSWERAVQTPQLQGLRATPQSFLISPLMGRRKQTTFFEFFSLKILCCHDDTWFHLNLTFLKPWVNQCVFLMEMFFLSYVNDTKYLLWNLPFFKMVPPKTNFWLKIAHQTSIHINCFTACRWHTSCHPISKMYCGRGTWWSFVRLEMSLLSDWQLSNRHKTSG